MAIRKASLNTRTTREARRDRRGTTEAGQKGWDLKFKIPKDFMRYSVSVGELLAYIAELVVDSINKRTDHGFDSQGRPFKGYTGYRTIIGDDGNYLRDRYGRFRSELVGDPRKSVSLRSMQDVVRGKRLRDNLGMTPRNPGPNAKRIKVQPVGGRRTEPSNKQKEKERYKEGKVGGVAAKAAKGEGTKYVKFKDRAKFASGFESPPGTNTKVLRPYIGVTPAEWNMLISEISRDQVLAFVKKRRMEPLNSEAKKRFKQAKRAQQRARRARANAAKRAKRSAEAKHREALRRKRQLKIQPGESAKAAYKRKSRSTRKINSIKNANKSVYKRKK